MACLKYAMAPIITINPGRFCVCDVCFKHVVLKSNLRILLWLGSLCCYLFISFFYIVFTSGTSKWDIREKVWAYIERKNLANYPRPVFNRIPNFKVRLSVVGFISAHCAVAQPNIDNRKYDGNKQRQKQQSRCCRHF